MRSFKPDLDIGTIYPSPIFSTFSPGQVNTPATGANPKRFIVSAKTCAWKDTIELLAKKRPELKERLPVITGTEPPVGPFATLDTRKTESVLGLKSYVEWQDSVLDTVDDLDDLLRVERGERATASHVTRLVREGLRVRETYR